MLEKPGLITLDNILWRQLLGEFERPIIYSLSPGANANLELAKKINGLVNMYRVTADDWDQWEHVKAHFDVSRYYEIFFF